MESERADLVGGLPIALVVDDDEDFCMMLEIALEGRGHRVVAAHSAREAVLLLGTNEVDALVCDLTLGDGSAFDVLAAARVRPRIAVILSGFDRDVDRQRTLDAGFDAHLVKPTPVETLARLIAREPQAQTPPDERRPESETRMRVEGSSR